MSLTSIGNNAAASTVLIEGLDAQQRVIWRERVVLDAGKSSFTIGRSLSADLVLSDDHSAPLHASVAVQPDGALVATDLGSKNGIVTGKIRHHAARDLPLAGNQLQIGRTLLRIRSSREALAPEILDKKLSPSRFHSPVLLAAIGAGVLAVQLIYNQWLGAPRDLATGIVTTLAGTGFVVAAWSGIWALLSRILVSEWRWPAHAARQ